jgi:hypothetical protein
VDEMQTKRWRKREIKELDRDFLIERVFAFDIKVAEHLIGTASVCVGKGFLAARLSAYVELHLCVNKPSAGEGFRFSVLRCSPSQRLEPRKWVNCEKPKNTK